MQDPKQQYHLLSAIGSKKLTSFAYTKERLAETVIEKCAFGHVYNRIGAGNETRIQNLKKYSITTIEEAVGAAIATPEKLAEVIGHDTVKLLREEVFRKDAAALYPALERFPQLQRRLKFGARHGRPTGNRPGIRSESGTRLATYTTEFSLIDNCMPAIRDQGDRWTCVAFATCALVEYAKCRNQNVKFDASEQFHYWDTKSNDPNGYTSLGTYPEISFSRIVLAGICRESSWPYNPISDPPQNDPKGNANRAEALTYKVSSSVEISSYQDVGVLKRYIREGDPVAIAIPVYDSWSANPAVQDSGNIGMPLPGETSQSGHALVLVGFGDNADYPGGGFFIIRNSYGTTWGGRCPYGSGYGTIPYKFISDLNYSAFIVRA